MMSRRIATALSFAFAFAMFASCLSAQQTGWLKTRVKPEVAGVFVDNKYYGTAAEFDSTSHTLVLPVGKHDVKIIDPRYELLEKTITIEPRKEVIIRQELKPKAVPQPPFGTLKVKNGGRDAIYINSAYYGQADEFNGPGQKLLLPPGKYNLRIVPVRGSVRLEQEITITAHKTTTIRLK